ncbi:sporulation histidine kinase inhibitor Sda [Cohnella faecalis]|uniref:Sporulation histidine kinase inhibitor Sda n=1 Tax=Cohnella faecalis TaxID=2315694 RepID=A0A398CN55_9BACL|nr:sporulation histidine kinase inhibitor Sda [Cohnella faecalis]RIE01011.1 sporulation histidine kinase inhibitor Sda [Cohnella faecalis]
MNQKAYPYLVKPNRQPEIPLRFDEPIDYVPARRLSDKAALLRPLQDEHLLEVYREAKKMNLSSEFIELLEEAISIRQLEHRREA